jgi:hypothetical protein
MIARLLLYLLGGLATLLLGGITARTLLRPMLEARRRRELGAMNAFESCSLCFERIDAREDYFDKRTNRWTHAHCVHLLLNPTEGERK